MKSSSSLLSLLALAMLSASALAQSPTDPLFTIRRSNPEMEGKFDAAWVEQETWCTGQLIYDITNNGKNVVTNNVEATWTVNLPPKISLADPQSWGYTTTSGVGQTLGFSISRFGFYMSPYGTPGDTARNAFALTLRCRAQLPIDWTAKCSCEGLEDVTIHQGSIFALTDNQLAVPGEEKRGLLNRLQLTDRGYNLVEAIDSLDKGITELDVPAPFPIGSKVGFSLAAIPYDFTEQSDDFTLFDADFSGYLYEGTGSNNVTFTMPPNCTAFATFMDSIGSQGVVFSYLATGVSAQGTTAILAQDNVNENVYGTWIGFYATGGMTISQVIVAVSNVTAEDLLWGGMVFANNVPF